MRKTLNAALADDCDGAPAGYVVRIATHYFPARPARFSRLHRFAALHQAVRMSLRDRGCQAPQSRSFHRCVLAAVLAIYSPVLSNQLISRFPIFRVSRVVKSVFAYSTSETLSPSKRFFPLDPPCSTWACKGIESIETREVPARSNSTVIFIQRLSTWGTRSASVFRWGMARDAVRTE